MYIYAHIHMKEIYQIILKSDLYPYKGNLLDWLAQSEVVYSYNGCLWAGLPEKPEAGQCNNLEASEQNGPMMQSPSEADGLGSPWIATKYESTLKC